MAPADILGKPSGSGRGKENRSSPQAEDLTQLFTFPVAAENNIGNINNCYSLPPESISIR